MRVLLFFFAYLVLVILPFIPGWLVIKRKWDPLPHPIPSDDSRDGRIQATQLRERAASVIAGRSTPETLTVAHWRLIVPEGDSIVDAYSLGAARLKANSAARSVACDGGLFLENGVSIQNLADAAGRVVIGNECSLGRRVSSPAKVELGFGCTFLKLWGNPIATRAQNGSLLPSGDHSGDSYGDHDILINPGSKVEVSVKSGGSILVGDRTIVKGDLIARGKIVIGRGCRILGHVFSEQSIHLKQGSVIGNRNQPRTVFAAAEVFIEPNVRVFGSVVAERGGRTMAASSQAPNGLQQPSSPKAGPVG